MSIPTIDVAPLFATPCPARAATDAAILDAASGAGFMTLTGLPPEVPSGAAVRAGLLRLFTISDADKRKLYRRLFDSSHANLYRGWFPLQKSTATFKEGIDIGPDLVHADFRTNPADPLTEPTPLPEEASLPGWRAAAGAYYQGMERLGATLMRSIARGLGLPETTFDAAFEGGISTLRIIRYPVRPPEMLNGADQDKLWVDHGGARRYLIGAAHVDSGFVTLLAQDGVEGLQAKRHDGAWIDVPPREATLAVNFGGLLERWTGGRIKATEHRVVGPGRERCSIPFFYEPKVDARIAPLPLANVPGFAPFVYGDHLWASMTKFVEFKGLERARQLTIGYR